MQHVTETYNRAGHLRPRHSLLRAKIKHQKHVSLDIVAWRLIQYGIAAESSPAVDLGAVGHVLRARPMEWSLLVLVLGSVLQNPRELHVVEHAILDRRLLVHVLDLPGDGSQLTRSPGHGGRGVIGSRGSRGSREGSGRDNAALGAR